MIDILLKRTLSPEKWDVLSEDENRLLTQFDHRDSVVGFVRHRVFYANKTFEVSRVVEIVPIPHQACPNRQ
jgi:hypothetical protein